MSSNLANDDSEMMRVPTPEQEQVRAHSRQHDQLVAGAQTRHARRTDHATLPDAATALPDQGRANP
jgi:hypothetical protein